MSDYTPTMNEIRDWYIIGHPQFYTDSIARNERYGEEFGRAIAAHDAKVRAEQREEDAQIAEAKAKGTEFLVVDGNEFRRGARLTAYGIAAAIRAVPANTNTEEGN